MDGEDALSVVEFLTEEGDLRKQLRTADGWEYPKSCLSDIQPLSWSYCVGLRRTFWDPKVISCDLFWTQKVLIHISLTLSTGLLIAYLWPNKQKKLGLKFKNRAFYGI